MLPLLESNVEYITTYRSLTDAVNTIGERATNLIITNEQVVDADLMIPANIHLSLYARWYAEYRFRYYCASKVSAFGRPVSDL